MLLYSQSQFDTQTVLQEWDELEVDEVLSKLNGDFRICYSKVTFNIPPNVYLLSRTVLFYSDAIFLAGNHYVDV